MAQYSPACGATPDAIANAIASGERHESNRDPCQSIRREFIPGVILQT